MWQVEVPEWDEEKEVKGKGKGKGKGNEQAVSFKLSHTQNQPASVANKKNNKNNKRKKTQTEEPIVDNANQDHEEERLTHIEDHGDIPISGQKKNQKNLQQKKRLLEKSKAIIEAEQKGAKENSQTEKNTQTEHEGAQRKKQKKKGQEIQPIATEEISPQAPSRQKSVGEKMARLLQTNTTGLSPLQQKFQKKLSGGQFRWINEQLYTTSSQEALEMFRTDPSLFNAYHRGFQDQVKDWPSNPAERMIQHLKTTPDWIRVADFGCGEAAIARAFPERKIWSFDLHPWNEYVTVSDCANVPLSSGSIDLVICCLSLMGTNYMDFLQEAHRVLVVGGALKIAEVKSRFEGILDQFISSLSSLGFDLLKKDDSNKMFIFWDFKKTDRKHTKVVPCPLKACKYKKR